MLLVRKSKEKIQEGMIQLLKKWENYGKENDLSIKEIVNHASIDFTNIYGTQPTQTKKELSKYYNNLDNQNYRAVNMHFSNIYDLITKNLSLEKDIVKSQIKISNHYFLYSKNKIQRLIINLIYLYNVDVPRKNIIETKLVYSKSAIVKINELIIKIENDVVIIDFSKCKKKTKKQ